MPTASLTDTLDQLVLEIGYVTVPPRASDNLRTMRPGTIMDFDAEFMDEIPSSENRAKILTWMNAHPKSLLGVADVEHQKIMAASPYRWRRVLSWLLIALVVVVVLVAAWFTHGWLDALGIANAPKGVSDRDYFFAVIASYAGAVAHTLVAALKQRQRTSSGSEPAFTALGNFAIWVHVNETYLMVYAFVIPAAAYAVMLLNGSVALATAFLVGYSIDSVLEVLLTRFDKFTSARTEIVANPSV